MTAFTLLPLQATWCTAGQLSGKYWERGPKGGRGVSRSLQTLWPTAELRQTKQGKRGHRDRWQATLAVALSVCVSGWRPFMSSTCARLSACLSVCLLRRYLIILTCILLQPSRLINMLLPCIFEDKMFDCFKTFNPDYWHLNVFEHVTALKMITMKTYKSRSSC